MRFSPQQQLRISLGVLALGLGLALYQPVSAAIASGMVRARVLPSATADGSTAQNRLGRFGENFVIPLTAGTYGLSDEGSYFHAMTATPGTAYTLTGATQTAWVATTPTFILKNNAAASSTRIYLDYVRVNFAAAGTAGAQVMGAVVTDTGTRYSSAGTALTAYNDNYDSSTATVTTNLFAGAITATAAGTPRYVCRFNLKTAIPVIGDSMLINFGAISSSGVTASSAPVAACPPVVLGGGQNVLVYLWLPSQSAAPTGEVDAGWWER
jgi:hypothetical protein